MSSVKKIAKSTKTKAARAKSEAGKSTAARGRVTKRGAESSPKKARITATRSASDRSKTKAKTATIKTAAKHAIADKAKASAKPRTTASHTSKTGPAKPARGAAHRRPAKATLSTKASLTKAKTVSTKAKTVPATPPTAKAAARKMAARPVAKSGSARKAATAKPAEKASQLRSVKSKQSESAKRAKLQAGSVAAPRARPEKSVAPAAALPGAKLTNVETIRAVAEKAATKLAAHPEIRLALRPLPNKQAAAGRDALHGTPEAKGRMAEATIETSGRPVIQKIQKKMPAAVIPPVGSGTPASVGGGVATPEPVGEELKATEVIKAEIKSAEVKPAEKPGAVAKTVKPSAPKQGFKPTEYVVYPAHGVGQIIAVEEQEVAGFKLELFVISFVKDKMILKVPTPKSVSVGMRKLAGPDVVKRALNTLTGRARIKRTMWSRRAQEYEAKINSGDLVAIAEVVRDLYRSDAQPEQSYSERQLYEAALDRVAREIAVVQKLTETESLKLIDSQLQKGPRRGKAEEADAELVADTEEGDIDEAA